MDPARARQLDHRGRRDARLRRSEAHAAGLDTGSTGQPALKVTLSKIRWAKGWVVT